MSSVITVGRRLIPSEQIAYVEAFDAAANPQFQTSRNFKARLVMIYPRDSVLIEDTVEAFAQANGFRMLATDGVATNPEVHFSVESFVPGDGFEPTKSYSSRLRWRDGRGQDQSKLLLADAETVLATVIRGEAADTPRAAAPKSRSNHARRNARMAMQP